MAYKKGESGNLAGRPKGSKTERTKQWDELHESIISGHADAFNKIMADFSESDPHAFVTHYTRILEYFKPKYSRVEQKIDAGDNIKSFTVEVISTKDEGTE